VFATGRPTILTEARTDPYAFFRRIFERVRRRHRPVRASLAEFDGTCVGRRLGLLHYVPAEAQLDDARRLAQAELQLRESVSHLASARGDNTGLALEARRTREQVSELLEEPAGWLPRALTRWPSSNANVLRSLEAVTLAMARLRDDCDRLAQDATVLNETRQALSQLERGYARDLAREWQRAVVDRELMTRPEHVHSSIAVRRLGEEVAFLAGHLEARYQALLMQQDIFARELHDLGADAIGPPDDLGLEEQVERSAELIRQASLLQMKAAKQRIDEASATHNAGQHRASRAAELSPDEPAAQEAGSR
jgi:hypothetical protein